MNETHHTFSDIIGLWPSVGALAAEVGVSTDRVRKWAERDSIPGEWFSAVTNAARERGMDSVTTELMASIADARRRQGDGSPSGEAA